MNLTKFINEVDEMAKKYDKEKLLQIIHEVARTLPESSRNDFIQMIKNVEKSGVVSSKQKNQVLFKQQYEQWSGVLNALEEGEKYLLENIMKHMMTGITVLWMRYFMRIWMK